MQNPPPFLHPILHMKVCDVFYCRLDNIITMTGRIKAMRQELYQRLVVLGTPGDWTHILKQIGMFTYTGLNRKEIKITIIILKLFYAIFCGTCNWGFTFSLVSSLSG